MGSNLHDTCGAFEKTHLRIGLHSRVFTDAPKPGGEGYAGKLRDAERGKLQSWYAPHNLELYELVQRDFGWEKNASAGAKAKAHVEL